jgi:hypothetical protein
VRYLKVERDCALPTNVGLKLVNEARETVHRTRKSAVHLPWPSPSKKTAKRFLWRLEIDPVFPASETPIKMLPKEVPECIARGEVYFLKRESRESCGVESYSTTNTDTIPTLNALVQSLLWGEDSAGMGLAKESGKRGRGDAASIRVDEIGGKHVKQGNLQPRTQMSARLAVRASVEVGSDRWAEVGDKAASDENRIPGAMEPRKPIQKGKETWRQRERQDKEKRDAPRRL